MDIDPGIAKDLVWLPGEAFLMGSEDFYPEERPVRTVHVDGFWISAIPVTVAQFRRFVKATGYLTWAERPPQAANYPDADPQLLVPGSLVFRPTAAPVDLRDWRQWWHWVPGADWRHPQGPGSTLSGRDLHPVTHIAHTDAMAYATWAGLGLPTEAEWEYAARGGLHGATYAWGQEFDPKRANTWQGGVFPHQGYTGTTPVRSYRPNGYNLHDMTGNVWEWTADHYTDNPAPSSCCAPRNPSFTESGTESTRRVVTKGGSHLCAPTYCLRYRPAARQGQATDTTTGHLGFRCIARPSNGPKTPPRP